LSEFLAVKKREVMELHEQHVTRHKNLNFQAIAMTRVEKFREIE
jgi:hypothetical protein